MSGKFRKRTFSKKHISAEICLIVMFYMTVGSLKFALLGNIIISNRTWRWKGFMSISNDPVQITKSALTRIIGNNIHQYRTERGITQEELAEKVGIGASFIARIENGQKIMSVVVLYKIASALHVSSDMLLSEISDVTRWCRQ